MHVSFALFADAANLSQEGKLNVLGVFDALQVSALPAVPTRALCALAVVAGVVALGASLAVHDDRRRRPVLVPKGAR